MALFARQRIDPALATLIGRAGVLAVGTAAEGQVVATIDSLWFPTSAGWQRQPWHLVSRGGWDGAEHQLHWRDRDLNEYAVRLTATGRLPDVFNERVMATIIVQVVVKLTDSGSALISARRDLGDPDAVLDWRVEPATGTSAAAVGSDTLVAAELARLKAEYDLG